MTRPDHVPAELVIDYNAFGTESIDELHVKIEKWRQLGSLLWTDHNGGHWVALSMGVCREVLSSPERFHSSEPRKGVTVIEVERPLSIPIEMDGAEHRQYRRVLLPLFTPKRVRILEDTVREVARSLLSTFVPTGSCDVVRDYGRPLASTMFLGLIDWPLEDRKTLENLAEISLNGRPGDTPEQRGQTKVDASAQLSAYARRQVEARRTGEVRNEEDMTSVIMNSRLDDGTSIPDDKLVELLRLVLIAGLDTTQSVLSQTFAQLAVKPEWQEHLRLHRDRIPKIIDEFLRWNAPAMPSRTTTEDTELDGIRIRAGDTVHLVLAAANRDETEIPDAGTINLDRGLKSHGAFSMGPHHCVGAALARVVLTAALDEFHQAVGPYRLVEAESHIGSVWGMNRVELSLEAAQVPA